MSRAKDEWIGAHDDAKVPPHVRLRIFRDRGGICHIAKRKIMAGEPWDLDHIKALEDGGEHREANLAPALRDKHRQKTAEENSNRARADRKAMASLGIKKPSQWGYGGKLKKKVDGTVVERSR